MPEQEMLAVFFFLFIFVFFPALTLLFSLPPSIHAGQLEKGDPMDQGHYQRGTSSEEDL